MLISMTSKSPPESGLSIEIFLQYNFKSNDKFTVRTKCVGYKKFIFCSSNKLYSIIFSCNKISL